MVALLDLDRVRSFTTVVECGSFTRAACLLGHSKALVSQHVQQLEFQLGVTLLSRTTRRMTPTEAGLVFYQDGIQLLHQVSQAVDHVRQEHHLLTGTLRITSTQEYSSSVVVPALSAFVRLHPALKIQLIVSSQVLNLVEGQFDLAIRLGHLNDSSDRATQLGQLPLMLVGSPLYLAEYGTPQTLQDLKLHRFVGATARGESPSWQFSNAEGKRLSIQVNVPIQTDSGSAILAFALEGSGLTILSSAVIADALNDGRLVHLLPQYRLRAIDIFAVYPNSRRPPAKVRAFIDFLRARLG